jgi:Flp pilus assembly protein TadD
LAPDFAITHNNLGVGRAKLGRMKKATQHFSEALQLEPGYPEARNNLEPARQKQRENKPDKAIKP